MDKCKQKGRFPDFTVRFNKLMDDMTLEQFAQKIGVSRATAGHYSTGERIPDALGVKKIAQACGVTTDWLLGLSNSKTLEEASISEQTGLSDKAIRVLKRFKADSGKKSAKSEEISMTDTVSFLLSYKCGGFLLFHIKNFIECTIAIYQGKKAEELNFELQEVMNTAKRHGYVVVPGVLYNRYRQENIRETFSCTLAHTEDDIIKEFCDGKHNKKRK